MMLRCRRAARRMAAPHHSNVVYKTAKQRAASAHQELACVRSLSRRPEPGPRRVDAPGGHSGWQRASAARLDRRFETEKSWYRSTGMFEPDTFSDLPSLTPACRSSPVQAAPPNESPSCRSKVARGPSRSL
eukprot:3099239-Pleurochrysis_carterae.AAC.1